MVNAMRFGQFEPEETRIKFVKEVYNALSLRKISLATPFLSNLRKGGNVASCFIIAVEDDIDSIFDNIKRVALISKNGGGLGIFLGFLRAKGSDVNGYENAAGTVVQWIKILNDTLVAVNQSFTADTEIITNNGLTKISEIQIGGKVLTNDGTYRDIVNISSHENHNDIYEIETGLGITEITEGHPVMVVRSPISGLSEEEITAGIHSGTIVWKWIDAKDVEEGDYIISVDA
jgi:hypothetical protein